MNKLITGSAARRQEPGASHPRRNFIPVREPGTDWLLFLYDPDRQLIEVQRRGVKHLIDLRELKKGD